MNSEKKNSIWLSARYLILLFSSLIIYKINIDQYGNELIGAWFLILSIWTFGNAIDLGMGTAIVKFTAEYFNDKKDEIKPFISSSFYVFVTLGCVLSIILFLIGKFFLLNNKNLFNTIEITTMEQSYLLLGITFLIKYITIFFRSLFEGMNRFKTTSIVEIFSSSLLFIFVSLNAVLRLSLVSLSFFYLLAALITLLVYIYIFTSYTSLRTFSFGYFEYSYLRKIFSFSIHIQLVNLLGGMIDPIIKFLLGGFLGLESVTFYEVGKRFAGSVTGLFLTAFKTILPKVSILKNKDEERSFLINDAIKYIKFGVLFSIFSFGVTSPIIVFLIKSLYGSVNYIYVYLLLSLTESLIIFGSTIYIFMMGIGKVRLLTLLQIMNVILVSAILIFSLYLFKDLIGLIGYFVTVLLGDLILLIYIRKNYHLSLKKFLIEANLIKFLVFLVLLILVFIMIYYLDWNVFFLHSILSLVSFILIFGEMKNFVLSNYQSVIKRQIRIE